MTENNRQKGSRNEILAAKYLIDQGYKILDMNYTTKIGEIDIIALDINTLVFVEVKYRKSEKYGMPEEAVDFRKQNKIRRVASFYLLEKKYNDDTRIRFDVIGILGNKINHIKDGF